MHAKPKVLIYLGGSYPQRAAVQAIQSAGIKVAIVDRNENAPCRDIADFFIQSDVTDAELILKEIRTLQNNAVIIGAYGVADYAFSTAGKINEYVGNGAGSESIYRTFTDKVETKKKLKTANIKTPNLLWCGAIEDLSCLDDITERCRDKNVVVKGVDQNNSRGISTLRKPEAHSLTRALDIALDSSSAALIEEHITGTMTNVDGLMIDDVFFPVSTTRRRDNADNAQICDAMVQPAALWLGFEEEAFALAERCARALGYRMGPFTVDVIVDANRDLHVIEASPHFHCIQNDILRGGGKALVAYAQHLAEDCRWRENLVSPPQIYGACVQQFSKRAGVIRQIESEETLRSNPLVRDVHFLKKEGDILSPAPGSQTLVALIWTVSEDLQSLEAFMTRLNRTFCVMTD